MHSHTFSCLLVVVLLLATACDQADVDPLEPAPERRLEAFPLGQVVLDPDPSGRATQFMQNREKFIRGLVASDPDAFLYNFRDAFGQEQPEGVLPLEGWDSRTTKLRGHATGHYLSALAQVYAGATYDAGLRELFRRKMDTMIDVLYDLARRSGRPSTEGGPCNADPKTVPPAPGHDGYDSDLSEEGIRTDYWNWGEGFISGYPPDQFILLEHGAIYGRGDDQVWAPYYTLHKILAGLLDCYEAGSDPRALEIARGMADWVHARLSAVPTATRADMWNRYIAGEYGGMNEVLARLSRLTDEPRYLACARLFDNTGVFFGDPQHTGGLAEGVDTIGGKHANQHIPQMTGALEIYRCSGNEAYYRVARNFWDICTKGYMYCIGGVAGARHPDNPECFTLEAHTLFTNGFSPKGQNETCATYNLLKLSRQLFLYEQDAKFMEYYERALYNHILASVARDSPGNTYHVPLNPGAAKTFDNAEMDGFSCCNGTALESNTKFQDSIYFKSADDAELFVNLYIPSTLTWPERNLILTQRTGFPYSDTTTLVLERMSHPPSAATGGELALHLRVPAWATRGFEVAINGEEQEVEAVPGTYLELQRTWQVGDTVELTMPRGFSLDPLEDHPSIAAVFYGPVLLAADELGPLQTWRPLHLAPGDLAASFAGDPSMLRFNAGEIELQPFFATYGRHSVYFDVTDD